MSRLVGKRNYKWVDDQDNRSESFRIVQKLCSLESLRTLEPNLIVFGKSSSLWLSVFFVLKLTLYLWTSAGCVKLGLYRVSTWRRRWGVFLTCTPTEGWLHKCWWKKPNHTEITGVRGPCSSHGGLQCDGTLRVSPDELNPVQRTSVGFKPSS